MVGHKRSFYNVSYTVDDKSEMMTLWAISRAQAERFARNAVQKVYPDGVFELKYVLKREY